MDMHRSAELPDWTNVPPKKRNIWQQFAAETQGVGTPGNALSVLGFALVLAGLWVVITRSLWEGTLLIAFGRVADLADGATAQRTGTKSPLGRLLDASLDKAGALLALSVFAVLHVLPVWIAAAIAAQNVANILISTYAPWRHTLLHPSLSGKLATAGFWIAIVTFVGAQLLRNASMVLWYQLAAGSAYAVAIIALTLGAIASFGYLTTVKHSPPHKDKVRRKSVV